MDAPRWVMPKFFDGTEDHPADGTSLAETPAQAGKSGLTYRYASGDDWEQKNKTGPAKEAEPAHTYPRLTDIQNTCSPKDIGGPPGFDMLKEAMADPKHPENKELKDWFGGKYDPTKPNTEALKAAITKIAKNLNN